MSSATLKSWAAVLSMVAFCGQSRADSIPPTLLDPNLEVTTYVSGFSQPIGIIFLAADDAFVLEKASGQVKRVRGGVVDSSPVLDLPVNSRSERGLLSLALHPNFPTTPFVYIHWTESSTGADSTVFTEVSLLANRVDRYTWDGTSLTFDKNLIHLRALRNGDVDVPGHPGSANTTELGNHDGGPIQFGPDGKLYIYVGDQGRRGWMQNLPHGPFATAPFVDDSFGGPEPDDAHLSGVILRLNEDGSAPSDNPFFATGAALGGEVGANLKKVYSYGMRNGFGMAFDPIGGYLWEAEDADDAFSEINRIVPGMNSGWIQVMGPISRFLQYKTIETDEFGGTLSDELRYGPTRLASNSRTALSRLFMLPGAIYRDPEFSWKYEVAPAGAAFVSGNALGAGHAGTLWVGSARPYSAVGNIGGSLFRFVLTPDRLRLVLTGFGLGDRVADNITKFDTNESASVFYGNGFGATPDIKQGPDGNLYVVSYTDGLVYRISQKANP